MKIKSLLILVAVAIGLAAVFFKSPPNAERTAPPSAKAVASPVAAPPSAAAPEPEKIISIASAESSPPPVAPQKISAAPAKSSASKKTPPPKEPLQDPNARTALSLVGVDPEAEIYWTEAIFDQSLPDQEREDLMEDLNEAGLADPKHPTSEDLALIQIRLTKIEGLLPYADPFMVEHLGEAYKDLANLLAGLPVK